MLIPGELALHRLWEFTATGLAQAGTLRTNAFLGIVENPLNKSNNRTCRDSL
jgi:hypothetical protein